MSLAESQAVNKSHPGWDTVKKRPVLIQSAQLLVETFKVLTISKFEVKLSGRGGKKAMKNQEELDDDNDDICIFYIKKKIKINIKRSKSENFPKRIHMWQAVA